MLGCIEKKKQPRNLYKIVLLVGFYACFFLLKHIVYCVESINPLSNSPRRGEDSVRLSPSYSVLALNNPSLTLS